MRQSKRDSLPAAGRLDSARNDGVARPSREFRVPQKAATKLLGFFCDRFRRENFSFLDQQHEAWSVFYRDVGKNLAVQFDSGGLQAVNELAVSNAVQTSGCSDTLNPQAAILPLLDAAIAKRVAICAVRGFLRRLVEFALSEEKTFSPLKIFLAPCPALGAAFYASHGFCSF